MAKEKSVQIVSNHQHDYQVEVRTHKYETILEMWGEGWESGSFGDIWDELMGLHTGEKALWQYDDDELESEYQRAVLYFANKDKEQE